MEPRLTRGEYWLLETAVSYRYPMSYLCAERYPTEHGLEQVFNKPGHGLDRHRLVATLTSLFHEGLLEAQRDDKTCSLDESQIVAALDEKRPLENRDNPAAWTSYGLTPQGAEVWEAFAEPEWDRFILEETDDEARTGTATCMTLWRLQKYLNSHQLAGFEVDAQSISVEVCGTWNATYWKQLPSGHRAQFRWLGGTFLIPQPGELRQFAFAGFCEFRDGWYRRR